MNSIQHPWPWYIAGALIGLLVPTLLLLGNRHFGISANLRHNKPLTNAVNKYFQVLDLSNIKA